MNVVNDLYSETGNYNPGSVFISNLRDVSPFEAVMTTNSAASHVIALEFGETTGIESLPAVHYRNYRVYNLNGQLLIQTESVVEKDQLLKQLPAGVYIVNGKKNEEISNPMSFSMDGHVFNTGSDIETPYKEIG